MSTRPAFRIFVVDDEPVIASTLATILNINGFSAISFTAPMDALSASKSDKPDVLIADVTMPGLSGIELAIKMLAEHPGCQILLFSGQSATRDLLADARARGHNFQLLLKPVHPTVILANVGALIGKLPASGATVAPAD